MGTTDCGGNCLVLVGRAMLSKSLIQFSVDSQFALEMNRDHSVIFEITSKYCILDSSFDHDGYSFSSKGFLPIVVEIMAI